MCLTIGTRDAEWGPGKTGASFLPNFWKLCLIFLLFFGKNSKNGAEIVVLENFGFFDKFKTRNTIKVNFEIAWAVKNGPKRILEWTERAYPTLAPMLVKNIE